MVTPKEGFRTTQRGTRNTIREDLKYGYRRGFPVLREIVQNAIDRCADKVMVAAFDDEVGLGGRHPALACPGLLFVNDGPFETGDDDRLLQLADSGKSGDGGTIGKFGIGRIALLNYCDAFFFAAFDASDTLLALGSANPYEETEPGKAWTLAHGEGGDEAEPLLLEAVRALGFKGPAFAIWAPLRRDEALVPEDEDSMAAVVREAPSAVLETFRSEADLLDLFALTRLEEIGFAHGAAPPAHRYRIAQPDGGRALERASRKGQGPVTRIEGSVRHIGPSGERTLGRFIGREAVSDDPVFQTVTAEAEDSAAVRSLRKERAFTSVVLIKPNESQGITIEHASFLPLHKEDRATDMARLYLNGAFLVRKDRAALSSDGYEGRWNDELTREAVPLIAPVLLSACEAAFFKEAGGFVRIVESIRERIGGSHARALIRDGVLARVVDLDTGKARWAIKPADRMRPIPLDRRPESTRNDPYPLDGVGEVLATRDMAAFEDGTALCTDPPTWSKEEIEAVLHASSGSALMRPTSADALLALLEHAGERRLRGIDSLLHRRLAARDASRTKADVIAAIVGFAEPWPVVLRPEARNDDMKAIADGTGRPTLMRGDWIPESWQSPLPQLDATTLGAVLRVLADPEKGGRMGDEASLVALAAWRITRSPTEEPENRQHRVFRLHNLFDGKRETLSFDMLEARARAENVFAPSPSEMERATAMPLALDLEDAVRINADARDILGGGGLLSLAPLTDDAILARCARYTGRNEDADARLALFRMLDKPESNTRAFRLLTLGAADDDRPLVVLGEDDRENEALARGIEPILAATGKALVPGVFVESRYQSIRNNTGLTRVDREAIAQDCADPMLGDTLVDLDVGAREALIAWLGDQGRNARLHEARGAGLHAARDVVRERIGGRRIPAVLRDVVPILQPARNADAARVQEDLIAEWDAELEVDAFLKTPEPARHAQSILAALNTVKEDLPETVMQTAWLPRQDGDPVAPQDVLTLPGDIVEMARSLLGTGDAAFALQEELDPTITSLPEWAALAARLPDGAASRAGMLMRIEEVRPAALLAADGMGDLLSRAAKAGLSDGTPSTALLCALLRTEEDTGDVLVAFGPLVDDSAINARLRAVGFLCKQDKGKAFYPLLHANFAEAVSSATDAQALRQRLADTVALSQSGRLESVETLTRIDADVLLKHRLDESWSNAFCVAPARASDRDEGDISHDGHAALLDALVPFHEIDPEKALRLYVLFTARNPIDGQARERFGCAKADLDRARAEIARKLEESGGKGLDYYLDREIVVTIQDEAKDRTLVPNLIGSDFEAALRDVVDLWIKSEMHGPTCHVTLRRITTPDFEAAAGMLQRCARKMLHVTHDEQDRDETVHGLMPGVANAVLTLFDGKTASDQAGIAQAIRYIEDNIEARIDQLSPPQGSRLRQAQLDFRKADDRGDAEAKSTYLKALLDDDVALAELREAVCGVIRKLGYDDEGNTTVFELYQNARDALAQAAAPVCRTVRVTLADGCLSLLHNGRPINGHEGDPDRARERGWDRDLINMLSLNQSEKYEGDVGRFGLGFKCVHMLSAEPRIASGNAVAARIRGGCLPEPWPEGRRYLIDGGDRNATLIELPLVPEDVERGKRAFEAFRDNVPGLLLFTRDIARGTDAVPVIDRIECCRDEQVFHWSVKAEDLTDHIDRVIVTGTDGAREWLRIRCRGSGVLAVSLDRGMPSTKKGHRSPDFWQLAPLFGLSDTAAWMLDGPFAVDAGRMNMQGSEKDRGPAVRKITDGLGEALIALYDAGPEALGAGVEPEKFWAALSALFIDDYGADATMRGALHREGGGWSMLAVKRPVLPDITGRARRLDPKAHRRLSEDLADRSEAIVDLGRGEGLFGEALTSAAAEVLGFGSLKAQAFLAEELDADPLVTPDRADRLYDVFHDLPGLMDTWRKARFRNSMGDFQAPQNLDVDALGGHEALDPGYGAKGRAIVRMVQVERGREAMPAPSVVQPTGPDAFEVLERVHDWWLYNRDQYLPDYERAVYPEGFRFEALDTRITTDDDACDRAWFTVLSLAIFQTLPYNKDRTNLSFLQEPDVERHWDAVATAAGHELDDFAPWHAMLNDWFDKNKQVITFGTWRRSLPDLYMVRRYMDDYRQLFFSLPDAGRQGVLLDAALTPAASAMAQRFGADAPPLARALGNGGPWMIREMIRHDLYDVEEARYMEAWCWASRARMMRFYERIGCAQDGRTPGLRSTLIHEALRRHANEELLRFEGDYDLPIDILTRPENRSELDLILEAPA